MVVCDIGASLQGEGGDTGPAQETVDAIRKAGGEAIASTLSITEPKNAEAIVKAAFDAYRLAWTSSSTMPAFYAM